MLLHVLIEEAFATDVEGIGGALAALTVQLDLVEKDHEAADSFDKITFLLADATSLL